MPSPWMHYILPNGGLMSGTEQVFRPFFKPIEIRQALVLVIGIITLLWEHTFWDLFQTNLLSWILETQKVFNILMFVTYLREVLWNKNDVFIYNTLHKNKVFNTIKVSQTILVFTNIISIYLSINKSESNPCKKQNSLV